MKETGKYNTRTEWHRVISWNKQGQWAANLQKGAYVEVEGELRYREFTPAESDRSVRVAEIYASSILLLDRSDRQLATEAADSESGRNPPINPITRTSSASMPAFSKIIGPDDFNARRGPSAAKRLCCAHSRGNCALFLSATRNTHIESTFKLYKDRIEKPGIDFADARLIFISRLVLRQILDRQLRKPAACGWYTNSIELA